MTFQAIIRHFSGFLALALLTGAGASPATAQEGPELELDGLLRTGLRLESSRYDGVSGFEIYDEPAGVIRHGDDAVDSALAWLRAETRRPVFLWVHLYDAHAPYLPPDPYATRFGDGRPNDHPLLIELMNDEPSEWDPAALQAELDAYDGAIAYLDDELERLLGELERRGVPMTDRVWSHSPRRSIR